MPVSSESLFQLLREKGIYGFFDFFGLMVKSAHQWPCFHGKKTKCYKTICIYAPIGYYELHRVAQQEHRHVEGEDHCIH
jgi:hypothetical protein